MISSITNFMSQLKTSIKEKIVTQTIALKKSVNAVITKIQNNTALSVGVLASNLVIAYAWGVPTPILVAVPFIFAPKLLNPIAKYTFMMLPVGMMANDILANPTEYRSAHQFNLLAIVGLIVGKNVVFPKAVEKVQSFFAKKFGQSQPLMILQKDDNVVRPANHNTSFYDSDYNSNSDSTYESEESSESESFSESDSMNHEENTISRPGLLFYHLRSGIQHPTANNPDKASEPVRFTSPNNSAFNLK